MQTTFQVIGVLVALSLALLMLYALVNYAEEKGYDALPVILLVVLTLGVGAVVVWLLPERVGSPAYARRVVATRNAVPRSKLYPRRAALKRA